MNFDYNALIHGRRCFERDTLMRRQEQLKFNSLARMELFLWDLEIFLQIQAMLNDRIVLKGGAAAQFYLPIEYQRTSVDIDMVCSANKDEVEKVLQAIEQRFKGKDDLFKARPHKPKNPKTELPMITYYMDVPSVCMEKELFGKKRLGIQEIKVEFHFTDETLALHNMTSAHIFAVDTQQRYQLLPLDHLIGDKLTTLGPNTIGIPTDRADEQIKQIYDIDRLIHLNWEDINLSDVRESFLKRATLEARQRSLSVNSTDIFSDMMAQMKQFSIIDFENDESSSKLINDFQSLYIRKDLNRSPSAWAVIGAKLHLLIGYLSLNKDAKLPLGNLFQCEHDLEFDYMKGAERGHLIQQFREEFSKAFEKYSDYPAKVLKGKNPIRIMWAVVNPDNLNDVSSWIRKFTEKNRK